MSKIEMSKIEILKCMEVDERYYGSARRSSLHVQL